MKKSYLLSFYNLRDISMEPIYECARSKPHLREEVTSSHQYLDPFCPEAPANRFRISYILIRELFLNSIFFINKMLLVFVRNLKCPVCKIMYLYHSQLQWGKTFFEYQANSIWPIPTYFNKIFMFVVFTLTVGENLY